MVEHPPDYYAVESSGREVFVQIVDIPDLKANGVRHTQSLGAGPSGVDGYGGRVQANNLTHTEGSKLNRVRTIPTTQVEYRSTLEVKRLGNAATYSTICELRR
jgi:hypothetical protein